MQKKKKKAKQNKQQNEWMLTNVTSKEVDEEEKLTKDMIDHNRKWALKKNRKNRYTSD